MDQWTERRSQWTYPVLLHWTLVLSREKLPHLAVSVSQWSSSFPFSLCLSLSLFLLLTQIPCEDGGVAWRLSPSKCDFVFRWRMAKEEESARKKERERKRKVIQVHSVVWLPLTNALGQGHAMMNQRKTRREQVLYKEDVSSCSETELKSKKDTRLVPAPCPSLGLAAAPVK